MLLKEALSEKGAVTAVDATGTCGFSTSLRDRFGLYTGSLLGSLLSSASMTVARLRSCLPGPILEAKPPSHYAPRVTYDNST